MLRALCSSRQRPRHGPTFGLIAILLAWLLHNDGSGTIDSQRRQNVVYIAGASIAGTNYAQIALGSSRHVMSRLDATRHVRRVELVASCLCLHGGRQRSSIELNCASLIFCALDLHQSQEQLLEKVRWTCPLQSTLWRRPWTRVVQVALSDKHNTFCHNFSYAKMHGLGSMPRHDMISQVEFGLKTIFNLHSVCDLVTWYILSVRPEVCLEFCLGYWASSL